MSSRFLALISGAIFGLALSVAHSRAPDDPVLGTWKLNVEKSKFIPGPGWRSQIRVYRSMTAGIAVTWTGIDANGEKIQASYTYKYDANDYLLEPNDFLRTDLAPIREYSLHGALPYRTQSSRSRKSTPRADHIGAPSQSVHRRQRLDGMLNYYRRSAA